MALNIPRISGLGLQSPLRAWHLVYGYVAGKFVRISSLRREDKPQIESHLFSLSERDRYLRFGYFASDANIRSYVSGLNFVRDHLFGIYDGKANLVAVAHVAHISEMHQTPFSFGLGSSHRAEFGVSVLATHRGKGYGGRLFNRAVTYARNHGVSHFCIHALSENAQMLRIAKNRGATLVSEGFETEAHLLLPKADFDSHVSELVAEHFGGVDYDVAHGKNWMNSFDGVASTY